MKREIFKKFITILGIALLINSAVSYLMISKALLSNTRDGMRYALEILDSSLDYGGDLEAQLAGFEDRVSNEEARFTILTVSGEVCADNTVEDTAALSNHSDREEFREALKHGTGIARRYSKTMGIYMYYMALLSENGGYLLRIALPSTGLADYVAMLLPALFLSIVVSILIAMLLTEHLSRSIAQPLKEIAENLKRMKQPGEMPEFGHYQFDEMNVIADSTWHMTQEVREYIQKLEHERTVRQEFFSNVSHELKTPITSIRGFTELIESGMVPDKEKEREFLARILKETDHMTSLINDILMISRLETREAEVMLTEISMPALLREMIEEIRPMADKNQIELSYSCMQVSYGANLQQMQELFSNLLSNAVKYNKPRGRVHVSIDQVRDELVIQVYDTGIGIPQDSIPRVFERFYRVDKGRSRHTGGTGLGLAIVKHVVEYYDGHIEIESKLDIGTTITVYLPIRQ